MFVLTSILCAIAESDSVALGDGWLLYNYLEQD